MRNKLELLSLDESPPESPPSAAAPPWTELPSDVTANILQRLDAWEILQSAQLVCSTWWKVCQDPAMWRVIEIETVYRHVDGSLRHSNAACRQAVDRSQGQLVDLNITYDGDHELLDYIVNRSPHLRRLTLRYCNGVSGAAAAEAVKKLPELEELRLLSNLRLVPADLESIGRSCPSLNSFAHMSFDQDPIIPHNEYAVAISKAMPGLLHLQLDDCELDNIGLEAILDGCPHLQSLHLWGCSRVDLGGALGKRCRDQIKDLVISYDDYSDSDDNDDYSDNDDYDFGNDDYDYGNGKSHKWASSEEDEDLEFAAGELASCGQFSEHYGEDSLVEAGLSPFQPQTMVDPATVNFSKMKGVVAKGTKRPSPAAQASPSSDLGPQLGLTAAESSPPPKRKKPAGEIIISGTGEGSAGPATLPEGLPLSEGVGRIAKWLEQAAAKEEEEKDRYVEQLAAARAKLKKASDEAKAVKAELSAQLVKTRKAEDRAERLEAELKTANDGQGEVLRAYTKRLLLSGRFSELVNDLTEIINGNTTLFALEEAAKVVPGLDASKFGYERLEGAALFVRYAEVIRDHLGRLPILNELASSPELLTVEQIAACPIDRDSVLEAAFDVLPAQTEVEEPGPEPEQEHAEEAGGEEPKEAGAGGAAGEPHSELEKEVGDL